MKARLQQLAERINGLSLRERGLLALAVLVVLLLLWDLFVMQPVRDRQQRVQGEIQQVSQRVNNLTLSIQALVTEHSDDPAVELRRRIDAVETELAALESRLLRTREQVGQPRQAVAVLAGLLEERPGLRLVSLENLPAERLQDNGEEVAGLFVHRVRLIIEADHAGVREYLQLVSSLPSGIHLESLLLSVPNWPSNQVELILYSLALDDKWLGV